ncbi:fungal specific transcription factor domain-containing protein [Aspergillus mulundensis]|uniref:Zn(2)-C6 fungal-type domain-containing protein n=1 Tax=Aspergillus mulundensis TaxID=1810919 RepID=A0A3D8QRY7_9EURO|nr:Uncharacterized protein DSM5745_09976 [Aspergillus mulundensis]RDW64565.1 Uncharacterized protein DSM5745_09976 [Aspergillus mulundensis]
MEPARGAAPFAEVLNPSTEHTNGPPLQTPTPTGRTRIRRRALACVRCRRRKVRCDGALPACSNCARADEECFEGRATSSVSRTRLHYLEQRVQELEGRGNDGDNQGPPLSNNNRRSSAGLDQTGQTPNPTLPAFAHGAEHRPAGAFAGHHILGQPPLPDHILGQAPSAESPAVSVSSRITREQPLAHEVGLISLSNTSDPKYLGPSSGVTFARLIYESAPQSQGLPLSYVREQQQQQQGASNSTADGTLLDLPPIPLPSLADCQQYAEAFFNETPFYPFISQDAFYSSLNHLQRFIETSQWNGSFSIQLASAQILLILSLGARFLETRLGVNYGARDLFLAGMAHCSRVTLPESVEGVQTLLLMVLHSFYNPEGLNAWYLLHTIIASCLDLGLQRRNSNARETDSTRQNIRSAVFWSAYSMDRTLTTILGRPLTLRDEAIDQSFPGMDGSDEVEESAIRWQHSVHGAAAHRAPPEQVPAEYMACIYSLRFDRIVAEIKLMIYRVARSPRRFPWPQNLSEWQQEARKACVRLMDEVRSRQRGRPLGRVNPLPGTTVQRLEIKYHQCIMLLYRPSPQLPHPGLEAVQECFSSSMSIIHIHAELHRFSNMECSWLSAHSIFVAAITMLYCVWIYPVVRGSTPVAECLTRAEKALELLSFLSQWWSVAREPCHKLSRLISLTREGPESALRNSWNPTSVRGPMARQDGGNDEFIPDDGRSVLIDELGILRDLFDLGWLNDWAADTAPSAWDTNQLMPDCGSSGGSNNFNV